MAKTKKELKAIKEKRNALKEEVEDRNKDFVELTDDMLDFVNGGTTDFPFCPSQGNDENIVLDKH